MVTFAGIVMGYKTQTTAAANASLSFRPFHHSHLTRIVKFTQIAQKQDLKQPADHLHQIQSFRRLVLKMDPQGAEQNQPRTYLLGRRFRLRPGEDTMGVDVIDRASLPIPETDWETASNKQQTMTIGDTMAALWRSLTTRQPGGFIMEKLRRAQAVIINMKNLWLSLYFYPTMEMPACRYFYGRDMLYPTRFEDQDLVWRNPRAGQYHIAYQDPSPNPRWRMKQIVEFTDDRDIGRRFQISGCNMVW